MIGKAERKIAGRFLAGGAGCKGARCEREGLDGCEVEARAARPRAVQRYASCAFVSCAFVRVGGHFCGFWIDRREKERKKRGQSFAKTGLGHRHVDNSWNEKKTAGVSLSCHLSGARRSYSGGFENALTELNELAVRKTAAKTAVILIIVAFV